MTSDSESQQEAVAVRLGALTTKTKTRIGFWDVRPMFSAGRLAQVTRETTLTSRKLLSDGQQRVKGRGRPKSTWRRIAEAELQALKLNWGQAARLAKDRQRWRSLVDALCPTWRIKDR